MTAAGLFAELQKRRNDLRPDPDWHCDSCQLTIRAYGVAAGDDAEVVRDICRKGTEIRQLEKVMQQTDASAIRLETCHRSSPLHPLTRSHHPIAVMIDPIDLII